MLNQDKLRFKHVALKGQCSGTLIAIIILASIDRRIWRAYLRTPSFNIEFIVDLLWTLWYRNYPLHDAVYRELGG